MKTELLVSPSNGDANNKMVNGEAASEYTINSLPSQKFQAPTTAPIDASWEYNDNLAAVPCTCGGSGTSGKHSGIDYGCGWVCNSNTCSNYLGQAVVATASGRVYSVSSSTANNGYGKTVVIAHKTSASGSLEYSLYAHLDGIESYITASKYINKGCKIGTIGKTGSGSCQAYHLHFEINNNGLIGNGKIPSTNNPYSNPADYVGLKTYYDLVHKTALPSSISKSGVSIPISFNSPFSQACVIDVRLALYNSSGTYLGTIKEFLNQSFSVSNGLTSPASLTFSKSSLTSAVGNNYQLRLEYKMPSSTTWFLMPGLSGSAGNNPQTVSITN